MASILGLLLVVFCISLFVFFGLAFPLWCVVDCATSRSHSLKSKPLWILMVIFIPLLGSIVYSSWVAHSPLLNKIGQCLAIAFAVVLFGGGVIYYK